LFQGYFIENNPISIIGAHAVTASEPKKLSVEDLRLRRQVFVCMSKREREAKAEERERAKEEKRAGWERRKERGEKEGRMRRGGKS